VARGIDIDDISLVINFDVPHDAEDYVHRIGRTARADRDGEAITLVRGREIADFMDIEKFLEKTIEKIPLPEGLGESPEYVPIRRNGNRQRSRGGQRGRNNRHGKQGRQGGHGRRRNRKECNGQQPKSQKKNPSGQQS
jgi:superfamily II DNA/RNA helicase